MRTPGIFLKSMLMLSLAILAFSCQKSDEETKMMVVKMTDSPGNYAELNLTVEKVEAFKDGKENKGNWVSLNSDAQAVNVLSLTNGKEINLSGNSEVEAGAYSKIRITFDEQAELVFNADASIIGIDLSTGNSVMLSWSSDRVVEIEIAPQVSASASTEVLIDFDVASSIIRQSAGFAINPVIREVKHADTGVRGKVEGNAYACVIATNGSDSASSAIDASGSFLIRGLAEGTYDVYVRTSEDPDNGTVEKRRKMGQTTIVEGEISQMGTLQL